MKPALEEKSTHPSIRLRAGGREAVFPAAAVRQILPAGAMIRVPLTRPAVVGVIAPHSRAIPIYRLAVLLGVESAGSAAGAADQIVVVEIDGALAGLLVEHAEAFRGRSAQEGDIIDGLTLLSSAGLFQGGRSDQQAARAAEGVF
jgi:chemotaxis signal transduction protein